MRTSAFHFKVGLPGALIVLCLWQSVALAQEERWVENMPEASGILTFDSRGRILSFHRTPDPPNDVEIAPSNNETVTVTQSGEFIIFSGTTDKLSVSFFQEINDVDVLETPNDFLLTSRASRRVFFYNRKTQAQEALPYLFKGPTDADLLANGHLLVCDSWAGRVLELTREGEIVWSYGQGLAQPMDALRLPNGNTLITDFDHHRILEIEPDGEIASQRTGFNHPMKMTLLPTGNILVADGDNQRLVECRMDGGQRVIRGHLNFIQAAAFLPKKRLYICAVVNKFFSLGKTTASQISSKERMIPIHKSLKHRLKELFLNRFAVLGLAVILWAIRKPGLLIPSAYILTVGVAYRCLVLAESGPPYRPDMVFWFAAVLLIFFSYRDTLRGYLPKTHWQVGRRPTRFPFNLRRTVFLLLWSVLALLSQFCHMRVGFWGGRFSWYVPVTVWGIGLYALLRPLVSLKNSPPPRWTALHIGPVTLILPFFSETVTEEHSSDRDDEYFRSRYWANTSVIIILVIAACLYMIHSTAIPTDVHGDSAEVALYGIQVRDSGRWAIFDPGWYQIPNLFFLIPGWVMWLFGDNLFGMRMADALVALGTIPIFYLLARRIFFPVPSAIATFLFATSSYMIHFARLGIGYDQTTLFTVTVLYFLVRGFQQADTRLFCLAGCFSGLAMLSYQASHILFPLSIASILLFRLTRWHTVRNTLLYGCSFLIGFWVTIAPLAGNCLVDPEIAYSRANGVSIFAKEGRAMIRKDYRAGISTADIARGQVERSLLGPISYPDGSPYLVNRRYGGVLDPIPAVLFIAGFILLFVTLRNPAAQILLLWTPVTVLAADALTNNAPAYQRLVGAVPLFLLIVAPVLHGIISHIGRSCRWSSRARAVALVSVLAVFLGMNMHRYFHEIMSVPQVVDEWTRIARYLDEAGPTQYTYFFGPPYVYFNYGTIRFLAPKAKGEDVRDPKTFLQRTVSRRGPICFLLVRSHRRYIFDLRHRYPGGKEEIHADSEGRAPFITYEVNL